MDSLVPSVLSAGLPPAGRKRKGPKRPSAMKYGHAVIKDLLEKLPDNTPRGTVLRGGPDNLPLVLKRDNPWVIHFDRKTADGGVYYWPWPQTPNPAIEETLTKKIYDIRTDPLLTALNEVRFSKSRRVLSVGGRKSAKKWVPNEITPETEGEHKGKAYIPASGPPPASRWADTTRTTLSGLSRTTRASTPTPSTSGARSLLSSTTRCSCRRCRCRCWCRRRRRCRRRCRRRRHLCAISWLHPRHVQQSQVQYRFRRQHSACAASLPKHGVPRAWMPMKSIQLSLLWRLTTTARPPSGAACRP